MGKRYFAMAKETSYGSSATISSTEAQYFDLVSESIAPDQGMIDIRTAGYRSMRKRVPGGYVLEGSVDFIGDPNEIATLVAFTFGQISDVSTASDASGTATYKYTMEPEQELDSFTAHIAPAVTDGTDTYKLREAVGGGITGLTLEAAANDILTATADMVFKKDKIITDSINEAGSAPGFSDVDPFVFTQGSVTLGGDPQSDVEAFSLSFENDIDTEAFVIGSRFLPGLRIQGFDVTGSLDLAFENWAAYQKFLGSSSRVMPDDENDSYALVLEFEGGTTGNTGAADYSNYKMTITLPEVWLDTTEASFDARDRIVQSIEFTATHNGTRTAQIVVVNTFDMSIW